MQEKFDLEWNQDKNCDPVKVSDRTLEVWEAFAKVHSYTLIPGTVNWPMIVRSLIIEIRNLQEKNKEK